MFYASNAKPFWDSSNEFVDITLIAEVLVAVYRFLPEQEYLAIFAAAMEPERSDAVKTCVLRALMTIHTEVSNK